MIDMDWMMAEMTHDEGSRLVVYDDATGSIILPGTYVHGHPTIGIGRALDVNGLTPAEMHMMATNDIVKYLAELSGYSWFVRLDPVRQRVLVSMRHNLGLAGLLSFTDMLHALDRLDFSAAVAAGMKSKWYGQVPRAAQRLMGQLLSGKSAIDPDVVKGSGHG